jgi:hypothetical protein
MHDMHSLRLDDAVKRPDHLISESPQIILGKRQPSDIIAFLDKCFPVRGRPGKIADDMAVPIPETPHNLSK